MKKQLQCIYLKTFRVYLCKIMNFNQLPTFPKQQNPQKSSTQKRFAV